MITEEILKVSRSTGKDILVVFGDFLDYSIDCFTPPRPIPGIIDKNNVFFNAFASLQLEYLRGIDKHGAIHWVMCLWISQKEYNRTVGNSSHLLRYAI